MSQAHKDFLMVPVLPAPHFSAPQPLGSHSLGMVTASPALCGTHSAPSPPAKARQRAGEEEGKGEQLRPSAGSWAW